MGDESNVPSVNCDICGIEFNSGDINEDQPTIEQVLMDHRGKMHSPLVFNVVSSESVGSSVGISRQNVGRIAERIVSIELEYRGFRVSDLNKEGISANADLLAVRNGKTWQIQVKGATEDNGWWFNYGFGSQEVIDGESPVFNSASGFYKAQIVVLVCVKSPREYRCVILPIGEAERAAQINLEHSYRNKKSDGSPKKPGKMWVSLGYIPQPRDLSRLPLLQQEQEIISKHTDNWNFATD